MTEFWGDLPAWVRAGPLVVAVVVPFVGTALLVAVGGWAAALASGRLHADLHWSERARAGWPVSTSARFGGFIGLFAAWGGASWGLGLVEAPRGVVTAVAVGASLAGSYLAGGPLARRVWGRPRSVRERVLDPLVLSVAYRGHLLAVLLLALLTHDGFDRWTVVMVVLGLAVMGLVMRGDHLDLLRLVGAVRPASARVEAAGARAAATAGVAAVPVDELQTGVGNAAAFPIGQRLLVTRGLADTLGDDALTAVLAHEYAHLSEGPRVLAARVTAALAIVFPLLLARPVAVTFGLPALVVALGVGFAVAITMGRVARRMEERADHAGGAHADPGVYAAALEAIYRMNLMPAVMPGRGRAHPHLYDRLLAAGVTPAWPRPAAPSRAARIVGMLTAFLVALGAACAGLAVPALFAIGSGEGTARLRLALGAGRPWDLTEVAQGRFAAGEPAVAARLYAAAAELSPTSAWEPANLSLVLAGLGECEAAARAAREARARVEGATEGVGDADGQPGEDLFDAVDGGVAGCFAARSGGLPLMDAAGTVGQGL